MDNLQMNRSFYFNYCEEKLTWLCVRIEVRGKLNILDLHLHSEDFYLSLFNLLYGFDLVNLNTTNQNAEAIDLIDSGRGIVIQVSATATKSKIEIALNKDLSTYSNYAFKFISISKDCSPLKGLVYSNPHSLKFQPSSDIYDVKTILSQILHLKIADQKGIFELLKKELGHDADEFKAESNIAAVISILAKADLSQSVSLSSSTPFNISEKLEFNKLVAAAHVVEDYKIHQSRVDKIYAEFDSLGQNKSKSVMDSMRSDYLRLSANYSADDLFFKVVDEAVRRVEKSANYIQMPSEELELCVSVLAVDAFIRCKIFKNPETGQHAPT